MENFFQNSTPSGNRRKWGPMFKTKIRVHENCNSNALERELWFHVCFDEIFKPCEDVLRERRFDTMDSQYKGFYRKELFQKRKALNFPNHPLDFTIVAKIAGPHQEGLIPNFNDEAPSLLQKATGWFISAVNWSGSPYRLLKPSSNTPLL